MEEEPRDFSPPLPINAPTPPLVAIPFMCVFGCMFVWLENDAYFFAKLWLVGAGRKHIEQRTEETNFLCVEFLGILGGFFLEDFSVVGARENISSLVIFYFYRDVCTTF